ncbi:hypothetical protein [Stieleria mannarensis]|uniref:hypothetical protein n=1 Tax=Stieleria mannarensis TaxID=2755585 RepID=UPI0015FEBDE9|nr:hypothetical protein [Rhodopirellula sp. JC639]
MRLPPWAIEAIRNGVADVARKASDTETITRVKAQAAELLRDLPENASRSIDALVKTASETARGAIDSGRESVLRWTERQTDLAVPCINAGGILFSRSGTGVPVSNAVLQLGVDILRGDCVDNELNRQLDRSLARMLDLDGHAVAVATSLDAAIASLTVLAQQRKLAMHRSQAIRLPSGTPLPDAFGDLTLVECGGVQAIEPHDFDGIDHACVVLADDGQHPIGPIDFKDRDVVSVAVLPIGTIRQTHDSIPNVQTLLQSGIDLVLLSGGPLTGGTAAGILAGKKTLIDSIQQDDRWNTYQAATGIVAMTLAAMTDSDPSPLSVLIDTGEENLRSRAERMAIRLTADESITGCQITDRPARLIDGGRWEFPSRQLNLRHKTLSAQPWSDRLAKQNPAVITAIDGEHLVIDLRWLPAAADSAVAAALGSNESSPSDDAPGDAPQT